MASMQVAFGRDILDLIGCHLPAAEDPVAAFGRHGRVAGHLPCGDVGAVGHIDHGGPGLGILGDAPIEVSLHAEPEEERVGAVEVPPAGDPRIGVVAG